MLSMSLPSRRYLLLFIVFIVLPVLIFFWAKSLSQKHPPPGIIWASGIVEGDQTEVAPKIPGEVARLLVKEGDKVEKRALIALMDSQEIEARVKGARAQAEQLKREVEKARVALELTREVVKRKIQAAQAGVKAAEAQLQGAMAQWVRWRKDWERFRTLRERRVISQKRMDEVEAAYKSAEAQVKGEKEERTRAQAALKVALAGRREIILRAKELEALSSAYNVAKANLKAAQARLDDTRIYAPTEGRVVEKLVEEGEVVTGGTPLIILVDLNSLYLKVYLPETQMGKVALGQKARIYVDSFPHQAFPAKVCYVASKSEFTPKEVQTHRERVQYTFAAKLCIAENRGLRLKPGMPGDGVIQTAPGPWWNPIEKKVESP